MKKEDFFFSQESLRSIAKFALAEKRMFYRWFLNGVEFTDRGSSPLKVDFQDSILVANNIIGATPKNKKYLITYEIADPKEFQNNMESVA